MNLDTIRNLLNTGFYVDFVGEVSFNPEKMPSTIYHFIPHPFLTRCPKTKTFSLPFN